MLALLLAGPITPSFAQTRGSTNPRADDTILEMAQSFKQRDRKHLQDLLPKVQGHVLEPWAAYWELTARLDSANPKEISDFLTRYAGSYQEDRLRNDWLLQLGRNRDWASFSREHPLYRMNDDRSVRCYALLADHTLNKTEVSGPLLETWLNLKEADEGCSALADQLLREKTLLPIAAWQRARLGMENDRLRVVTQAVGLLNPDWVKTINSIYLNPGKYLNDKLTALRPQTREFVSLALIRQAYLEPTEAAVEIEKLRWRAQLTDEERSWVWGAIGRRAAQKLSTDALAYFSKANVAHLYEEHLVWMARAALRLKKWNQVQEAINAMPPALQGEPGWIYWRARATLAQSPNEAQRAQAVRQLQSIASSRGFYEQLALEELGQKAGLPLRPTPPTPEERQAAQQNPGLQRALYAIQIGLRLEGVREWNYSISLHTKGGMDDRSLLAAAELACKQEIWDRCINTSERTRSIMDVEQRFPTPFRSSVQARSQQIGLDPAYVYGLIRQESRFIMDAKSVVGASGLMQVMPATARWTAKKIGLVDFQPQHITDRETNITIGTGYLKLLLDSFNGSMPLTAAAYNAGPGRPRLWRGSTGGPVMEGAIWAENVPFNETRDYVKKVLYNTTLYAALLTGQSQSLKERLGTVGPANASNAELGMDLP